MSRKTQRYSKEFKAEAVRTVLENQLSISEGASRLSLPEGTLGQWVTAARKGLGTPGSRTVAELESEILQLRKALNEALRCTQAIPPARINFSINNTIKLWIISS
ncbi:IS600 ORF1-like protein [Escherichia coli]|nr:IS600 ORF1-like protein [Escherichia coli]